jgi:hypothetical protein
MTATETKLAKKELMKASIMMFALGVKINQYCQELSLIVKRDE